MTDYLEELLRRIAFGGEEDNSREIKRQFEEYAVVAGAVESAEKDGATRKNPARSGGEGAERRGERIGSEPDLPGSVTAEKAGENRRRETETAEPFGAREILETLIELEGAVSMSSSVLFGEKVGDRQWSDAFGSYGGRRSFPSDGDEAFFPQVRISGTSLTGGSRGSVSMGGISDYFERDARRYDAGFEIY